MLVLSDIGHLLASGAWGALVGFVATAVIVTIFAVAMVKAQRWQSSEVQDSLRTLLLSGLKFCLVGAASGEVAALVVWWAIIPVLIIAFLVSFALTRRARRLDREATEGMEQ